MSRGYRQVIHPMKVLVSACLLGRRPVPRPPVEIVDGVVREKDGTARIIRQKSAEFGPNTTLTKMLFVVTYMFYSIYFNRL